MNAERVLNTTAFMQRLNMEPACLHVPPKHRRRTYSKRQQRCQASPAEKEMSVWLRPAEEQRNPNQLDYVDELCEETDTNDYSKQQPIAHFPCFESLPRQIRTPSPEKYAQGIYRHQNRSHREQWDYRRDTKTPKCGAVVVQSLGKPKQLQCGAGAEQDQKTADTKNRDTKEVRAQRDCPGD